MRHDACTLVTAGHCLRAQRRVSLCAGRAAAPSSHGPASARTSRDNTLTEVTAFICDAATPDRVADHLIAASTPPPRPSVSGCVFLVIKYSRVRLLNPP